MIRSILLALALCVGALSASAAVFLQDNFNDTNGTLLSSHTVSGSGATGGAWAQVTSSPQTATINSNQLESSTAAGYGIYYNNQAPGTANYSVKTRIYSIDGSSSGASGPILRASSSAETFYDAYIGFGNTIGIYRAVSATFTQLATMSITGGIVSGQSYDLTFTANGSSTTSLTVTLQRVSDGFWLNSSGAFQSGAATAISISDSSGPITAAGFGGVIVSASTTAGLALTNVTATSVAIALSPTTLTAGSTGNSVTVTGTNTAWTAGTPGSPTFTLGSTGTGASITAQVVNSTTSATLTINAGTAGTITITDPSPDNATATITVPNVIPVNNSNLFYSPYNWVLSGSSNAQALRNGAYLKTGFTGTSIGLNIDVSPYVTAGASAGEYPYVRWTVDGATYQNTQLTSSTTSLSLATGLSAGTHSLVFIVVALDSTLDTWTIPVDTVKITGVVLDAGSSTSAPTLLSKRALIYGDSLTDGYLAKGATPSTANDDGQLSYASYVGQAFAAEFGILGYTSQGWTVSGQGGIVPLFTPANDTQSSWNKYFAGSGRLVSSAFSPAPDYIFNNHGRNDSGASDASVTASVSGWLTAVRAAAPSAYIFVVIPFAGTKRSAITAGFSNYQTATPDGKAKLIDTATDAAFTVATPTYATVDGTHPNTRMHGQLGAMVTQLAQAAMGGSSGGFIIGGDLSTYPWRTAFANDNARWLHLRPAA